MERETNGLLNGRSATLHNSLRTLSTVLLACVGLAGIGCLTPGQTQSVGQQLGDIRQQAEQVRSAQQRNAESIGDIATVERQAIRVPVEEPVEVRQVPAQQAENDPVVVADHASDRDAIEPSGAATAAGAAATAADEGLFREGYALYHRRDYQGAEQNLRRFLAADPRGPMADDALFWIGECRFARGLYRDAIFEYRDVIESHPASHQVPRSWYMIALSYERLGESAAMNEHLAVVVDKFPDSEVAPLARDRLGTL